MTVSGAYRSSTNMRGGQSATVVDEVLTSIVLCGRSLKNWTFILNDAFTKAQLDELLASAPTVTGTKTINALTTAGWAAMNGGQKTAMIAAFLAKGYVLTPDP
jgi:hypothetical protein